MTRFLRQSWLMASGPRPRVVSSTTPLASEADIHNVPGNAYDKHGSRNPLVRVLMHRFHKGVLGAIEVMTPASMLDVGCGEGRTTALLAERSSARVFGLDLEEIVVREAAIGVPRAAFIVGSAYELPFESGSFDLVVATEVMEHLDEPSRALEEMVRVASKSIVLTVPHEPWWRVGNLLRGRYVKELGNTPGHIQHWSQRTFGRFLEAAGHRAVVGRVGLWILAVIRLDG
jgi:ubiquinone/menaquinone biosynthesis C-methylase UbiE